MEVTHESIIEEAKIRAGAMGHPTVFLSYHRGGRVNFGSVLVEKLLRVLFENDECVTITLIGDFEILALGPLDIKKLRGLVESDGAKSI